MSKDIKTPQGVVAILAAPDGRELATASDFHTGTPGGFEQQEAQQIRAKRRLGFSAIRELASPILSDAIDNYLVDRIIEKMCDNGCRIHLVPIGYDDDEA